ncbi:MAG TPA: transaldolase, partial [Chroococcales cyanobacterium]
MTGVKVMTNPLKELQKFGQSVWLDYIRRSLIQSGELKRMIDEDGLRGMTSNPAIFEKAIAGSTDYADFIKSFQGKGTEAPVVYEKLAVRDIQDAADLLLPVYKESKKRDGYISLEVSPFLANDTDATIAEAKRLWKDVERPNVMIKVPGTRAGLPAVKELISEGINVNVTLLFFQKTYEEFAQAYIEGLEAFEKKGGDVSGVASVASFFISRIDSLIDKQIEERLKQCKDENEKRLLESVEGKVAIANGKLTYQKYKEIFNSERWNKLKNKGAMTQRVLWASTSTKNPKYPDTLYVDELIGPDTVNTIPPATYDAFKDHGHVAATLESDLDNARQVMESLEKLKISMKQVTDELVEQGVKLFCEPFQKLLDTVSEQLKESKAAIDDFSYKLPADLEKAVKASLEDWQKNGKVKKLWAKDASLWTGKDEGKWLDWLTVANDQQEHIEHLTKVA